MINPHWYVGPWQWSEVGSFPAWTPPDGTVGCLDLRAIPHMSKAGGNPQGQGIFLTDGPLNDSNYTLLGSGGYQDIKTSQALRDRMPKRARTRQPVGDDLLSHLLDAITDSSDPTGDSFAKPLMPDAAMRIGFNVGPFNYQWKTAPWAYHWDKIQDVERADFQRCFDDAQAGRLKDAEHHRRVLDALCDKYSLQGADDWKTFVPTKLRKSIPGRLKHETSYSDDFNRTDENPIAAPWTVVSGGIKIISSAVQPTIDGFSGIRYGSDLSSADHYATLTIVAGSLYQLVWPSVRFSVAADTYYCAMIDTTPLIYTFKRVAGTLTELSRAATTYSGTVKAQISGSSLTAYRNGTLAITSSDTAITGNTRAGLGMYRSGASNYGSGDDWTASDLVASGTNYTQLERSTRGYLRGVYTHWQG